LSIRTVDKMDNLINISTLGQRYGLKSRQAVYDRLKDLNIKPTKRGKIAKEDLVLLDELDKHINSGGTIDTFTKSPEVMEVEKIEIWEEPQENVSAEMLLALIEKLIFHQQPLNISSPLSCWEELEKVANHGWILPTSTIKSIIGIKPRGDNYSYGSFVFIRSGKVGREIGWIIRKSLAIK